MTLDLQEVAKALIGAEENAPAFGDLLQPGQSVTVRVAGVQGPEGSPGLSGPPGQKGDSGPDGPLGPKGDIGPEGPPGKDGVDGKDGAKGDSGNRGQTGATGDHGPEGKEGPQGERGPQGFRGARGPGGGGGGGGSGSGGSQTGAVSPLVLTSNDPAEVPLTLVPDAGQTEALLILENETAGEAVEAFANGSINQYLTDPAVIGWLIKMAAGQTASPLRVTDSNNNVIFDFDPVNGTILIRPIPNTTPAVTSWYAQAFANYSESDVLLSVNGIAAVELDTYVDNITPANSYTHIDVKTQTAQAAGNPVTRFWNSDLGKYVHRILPSGAISTSGTVPADGDILTGETFFAFDPTNGAASPIWKGKQADGTVVSGSLGGGAGASGVLTTEQFAGDGIEDTFTLANTPSSSYAIVTVNGAQVTTYGISGDDVVFTTAPDDDAEIIVSYVYGGGLVTPPTAADVTLSPAVEGETDVQAALEAVADRAMHIEGPFTVNYNDANVLTTGVTLFTPEAGYVIYNMWFEYTIAFAGSGGWNTSNIVLQTANDVLYPEDNGYWCVTAPGGGNSDIDNGTDVARLGHADLLGTYPHWSSATLDRWFPARMKVTTPLLFKLVPTTDGTTHGGTMTAGQIKVYAMVGELS